MRKRINVALAVVGVFFGLAGFSLTIPGFFADIPYVPAKLDPLTPQQVEYNVYPFYFEPFERLPFNIGSVQAGNSTESYTISEDSKSGFGLEGEDVSTFGTFNLFLTEHGEKGPTIFVRPNQYPLGLDLSGKMAVGIRPLPVADADPEAGHIVMDAHLRSVMGLGKEDVIFAPIYYFHPEFFKGSVFDAAHVHRTDDGFTHMGAYIGGGKTRNAPFGYHNRVWGIKKSYPANVAVVKYEGAKSQAEFNQNAITSLRLLNETGSNVRFSRLDYKKDYYDARSLKSIFDFYRAWLDHEWVRSDSDRDESGKLKSFWSIIKDDVRYDTYCAEHITMVINVALNLPQNEQGYIWAFGSNSQQEKLGAAPQVNGQFKGGEYFFKLAQEIWEDQIGEKWFAVSDQAIQPLYSMPEMPVPHDIVIGDKKVLSKGEAISLDNPEHYGLAQWVRYDGWAMAWAPQTLPDLVSDFMSLYGRLDVVAQTLRPFVVKKIVQSQMPSDASEGVIQENVNITLQKMESLGRQLDQGIELPAELQKQFFALNRATYDQAKRVVESILDGFKKDALSRAKLTEPQYDQIIQPFKTTIAKYAEKLAMKQATYGQYLLEISDELEAIRKPSALGIDGDGEEVFFYYTPPTIINRIVQGNHRHNKYVDFEITGTAFEKSTLVQLEQQDGDLVNYSPWQWVGRK